MVLLLSLKVDTSGRKRRRRSKNNTPVGPRDVNEGNSVEEAEEQTPAEGEPFVEDGQVVVCADRPTPKKRNKHVVRYGFHHLPGKVVKLTFILFIS